MYRIYNIEQKKWVEDNIFIAPNDDLYTLKKSLFNRKRLIPISDEDYVIHKDIELYDKNENLVFEGDYLKAKVAEDRTVIGLVVYANELSSYIILCMGSGEFFTLGQEICEFIEIIGNVFDGYNEEELDGQQSLQKSEV